MNPQLLAEFNDMKKRLEALERAENVSFIGNMTRRLTASLNIPTKLADLSDVASTAPSVGEVLEWNGAVWAPGTDST